MESCKKWSIEIKNYENKKLHIQKLFIPFKKTINNK